MQTFGKKNATELLDMYYLEMRSHIVELAAGLDRITSSADAELLVNDKRFCDLQNAVRLLAEPDCRTVKILESLSD